MDVVSLALAKNYTNEKLNNLPSNAPTKTLTFDGGIYSVGNDVVNGQISDVVIKGRSLKNELDYNCETWEEWTKPTGVTVVNGELIITLNGSSFIAPSLAANFKPSTKYGILLYGTAPDSVSLQIDNNLTGSFVTLMVKGSTGNAKRVITTQSSITTNILRITSSAVGSGGEQIKIKDIRIFELPAGSEIEKDFETLTADELAQKYPYINGDSVKSTFGAIRLKSDVGRNLIIKSNALNNTISSPVGLSKWGYLLSNDKKSFLVNLDENEQYILSFLGHNEGSITQNVEVAVNGATSEKKTFEVVSGTNKYTWVFTTDNFKSNEEKTYPLQSLDEWSRYYKKSPAIVMNPNDTAYQKWGFNGVPLENMEQVIGGMFNNASPINGNLLGWIDTPATAWAGINISRMYLETNDAILLPKIRAIGDFFLNHVMDINIWGTPFKAMPNAVIFDEVSKQWVSSTEYIHTRTFYHTAWALLEIYDATKDTKYSNLAGQLLDSATMIQLIATGQVNSNELPPYFSGAIFNGIVNIGEASYVPDWRTFTNANGDVVVRATKKWIKLFGNSTRVVFDLYAGENRNYTVKSIADNYISHLLYLYNNQGLRKPDGHNLLYCFSHYEWDDEPHPDGYMVPVPMNWDFINNVFGKDQWFTGDLILWAIIGFAEAGETQIATSLLDRYYELRVPDSEGRLLFYDRYTAQGTPLVDDTSKSVAFTAMYMQARNILGNHDYDAECLSALEYYQKESEFNTVDGGFSWDTEDYNAYIENKSLGEILFSIMENVTKAEPLITVSFENFIPNPIYILDIKLEKGNKATEYNFYKESTMYVVAKDEEGNILELRSLPNGTKDEVSVSEGKVVKRVSDEEIINGISVNWSGITDLGNGYYRSHSSGGWSTNKNILLGTVDSGKGYCADGDFNILASAPTSSRSICFHDNAVLYFGVEASKIDALAGATTLDKFKAYINLYPITLTYQLAQPIITKLPAQPPLQVFENGTVYVEPISDPAETTLPSVELTVPIGAPNKFGSASHDYEGAAADWVLNDSEQKCLILVATNSGGNANIILPKISGLVYLVDNKTDYNIVCKSVGDAAGTTILSGNSSLIYNI